MKILKLVKVLHNKIFKRGSEYPSVTFSVRLINDFERKYRPYSYHERLSTALQVFLDKEIYAGRIRPHNTKLLLEALVHRYERW